MSQKHDGKVEITENGNIPLSNLIVSRNSFTSRESGEKLYSYCINDKLIIKGFERPIRIDLSAKDNGGYEMLDIIFMLADFAYLIVHDEVIFDDKTGRKTSFRVYEVANEDEFGISYKYQVKPSAKSDEALLNVLIQQKDVFVESIDFTDESEVEDDA